MWPRRCRTQPAEVSDAERDAGDVGFILGGRSQSAQDIACDVLRFSEQLLRACPTLVAWHYLGRKDQLMPLPDNVDEMRLQVIEPGNGARRGVASDLTLPVGFSSLLFTSKRDGVAWMAHIGSGGQVASTV